MKVLLLGATGSIGRQLLPQALALGHHLTVLVRDPARLPVPPEQVTVVRGDVLVPAALDAAVRGQQAVIYALGGTPLRTPTTFFSDSTRSLLLSMNRHGVRRLVCITGIGAGDSRGHGGFLYDRLIYPLFTRPIYEDKDRQEDLIRASSLDWIIVRPASFTNGPKRGQVRALTHLDGVTIKSVSRADVAAFSLEQLTSDRFLRQTPLIGD